MLRVLLLFDRRSIRPMLDTLRTTGVPPSTFQLYTSKTLPVTDIEITTYIRPHPTSLCLHQRRHHPLRHQTSPHWQPNFKNDFFPTSLCGVLVFSLHPVRRLLPSSCPPPASCPPPPVTHNLCSHTTYSHTTCSHTTYSHTTCSHTTSSHTTSSHTTYSHTTCTHTQLAHTQLTHTQLTHTQLTHTQLAHTQLAHTQLTHTQLAHTQLAHTQLAHTQLAQTQLTHTQLAHTCSETSLRIFVVECIARAQTIPTNWHERLVDSTRTSVRSMLSTSLLWGMFWCSMVNHQIRKIGRKWQLCRNENENRLAGSRLGRLPWTKMKTIEQVRGLSVPNPYHCATDASSLDGDIWSTLHPPAYMEWKSSRNYNKRTKQT